jgi:hypothetical protein
MLEGYDQFSRRLQERVQIGKIVYCVFLVFPVLIFIHFALFDDRMNNLFFFAIFGSILCLISVPLTGIGIINSFKSRHNRKQLLFWTTVTVIAVIPFLWLVGFVGIDAFHHLG